MPRCRRVRAWIEADHDGRLAPRRQVALQAHLARCAACREQRDELIRLAAMLRAAAAAHRPDDAAFTRISPEVLARMATAQDTGWRRRLRDLREDRHRLWFISGGIGATMAAILLLAAILTLGTPNQPSSLAALLRSHDYLGSNSNPIWLPSAVSLPHVSADTRARAILIQPLPPLELKHLALSAVVAQDGSLASLEVLHDPTPDAELQRAVSRLAEDVRFVPARARGRPVAMNVVWLIERTTVAAPDRVLGGA